jgi:hypothetical protein
VLTESEYGEAAPRGVCHSAKRGEGGMAQKISENSVERISVKHFISILYFSVLLGYAYV